MNISRCLRKINRITDYRYLYAYLKLHFDRLCVEKFLDELQAYHHGQIKDFRPARDRFLQSFLKYAYRTSPYYKSLFDTLKINLSNIDSIQKKWNSIPFLDKKIIKSEKDRLLALSAKNEYIGYMTTGGSTGQPFGFNYYGGHDAIHQEFLYKLMGYIPGDKILALDGTLIPDDRLSRNIYWIEKSHTDLPYGSMALSSHYLNNNTAKAYIDFINEFKPSIIRGYPSFVESIAKLIIEMGANLKFNIKGIQLTSETFNDRQVDLISRAFGAKVYSQYGHAESSVFGYSIDESMAIYCSPFYGYTEVIGENDQHVEQGCIGEIVVTGFNNHALPFIRYRTGDLGLYAGEKDGIVMLKQIYGRTQDIIYTDTFEEIRLTALVFGRHYKAFNNIEKWQIIQNEPGKVLFRIKINPNFSQEDELEISDNFMKIARISTKFEFVDNIPLTARGKSKLLIQNISKWQQLLPPSD